MRESLPGREDWRGERDGSLPPSRFPTARIPDPVTREIDGYQHLIAAPVWLIVYLELVQFGRDDRDRVLNVLTRAHDEVVDVFFLPGSKFPGQAWGGVHVTVDKFSSPSVPLP